MDFTNPSLNNQNNIHFSQDDLEREEERQRRLKILTYCGAHRTSAPGYFYGLDYSSKAQPLTGEDFYTYQGYTAQQPRRHWKYNTNPAAVPLNTYEMAAIDKVDPNRLIGDTLSNQKILHEQPLSEEEKRTFCTAFAPPPGFKAEHKTVFFSNFLTI